jgi:PKD repeat protein
MRAFCLFTLLSIIEITVHASLPIFLGGIHSNSPIVSAIDNSAYMSTNRDKGYPHALNETSSSNGINMLYNLAYTDSCFAKFTFEFSSVNSIQFYDASVGNIFNRLWDFGDGETSNEQDPVHTYAVGGIYKVSLSIQTVDSCNNIVTVIIPVRSERINGIVTVGSVLLPKGKVYLFVKDSISQKYSQLADTSIAVVSGYFTGLISNKHASHLIYVVPELKLPENHYPEYFPTYYGDKKYWEDAEAIMPEMNDSIKINLLKRDGIFYGHGTIAGSVNAGQFEGIDLEGACILLLNMEHQPLMYTFVDENNAFVLNHLPYGSYYLLIDKVGIPDKLHEVSLSASEPTKEISLTINENTVNSIKNEIINCNNISLYPNPFCNYVTVIFKNLDECNVQIKIINYLGQNVQAESIYISNWKVQIDLSHLPDGIYLIKILDQTYRLQKIN